MKKLFFALVACAAVTFAHAQTIVVDNFDNGANLGGILTDQPVNWTAAGLVTQNATTITVGGAALDVNGWGNQDVTINATGMNFLLITAQVDSGNGASSLVVAFDDASGHTKLFPIATSAFAIGSFTTVSIPINWGTFGFSNIIGWSIGGGTPTGLAPFHMTFDDLAFSAVTAVPEPSTYALMGLGLGVVGLSLRRRFRRA